METLHLIGAGRVRGVTTSCQQGALPSCPSPSDPAPFSAEPGPELQENNGERGGRFLQKMDAAGRYTYESAAGGESRRREAALVSVPPD